MAYNYSFKIKKGKFELEITSDNKYFVITQYDKLFKEFSDPGKPAKEPEKDKELEDFLYKRNFERDEAREKTVENAEPEPEAEPEVEPDPEPEPEPEEPPKNSKVYDILEEKLSSLPEEEKNRLNLNRKEEKQNNITPEFDNIEDLIRLKNPGTKLDYLLLASYYLQEKEDFEKYSLKQINSLILPNSKEPVDHSVIHEAVAHEYFEVVPDYLGTAGITEYKITKEGIDYILNELQEK